MDAQTRNVVAAAVAGAIIGAFSTAVVMSSTERRATLLEAMHPGPAINRDDIVAVLDSDDARPTPTTGSSTSTAPVDPSVPSLRAGTGDVLENLRGRDLLVPVEGVDRSKLVQSYDDERGGARKHQAIDILAPRNTPVLAVEGGAIARLFTSKAGGITVEQYDPHERFIYYYAHLERYADGLTENARVRRGQVLGYVGTTGNAPPNTPHLHFAICEMTDRKRWWEGRPIDPYLVLR